MSVNQRESTAKSATMGVGVDAIANPISGTSFGEAVVFQQVTIEGVASMTGSGQFNQLFVSGKVDTVSASGVLTFATGATSGTAVGGSGYSGVFLLAPQGFVPVVVSGVICKIPFFNAA